MPTRKWSAGVTTDSTHPEHNLFNQDATTIAKHLASKKVSPKGPASGMRMLNFYINRAGKNLPKERHGRTRESQAPPLRNHPQAQSQTIPQSRRKAREKDRPPESRLARPAPSHIRVIARSFTPAHTLFARSKTGANHAASYPRSPLCASTGLPSA